MRGGTDSANRASSRLQSRQSPQRIRSSASGLIDNYPGGTLGDIDRVSRRRDDVWGRTVVIVLLFAAVAGSLATAYVLR